jgi:hypothetical protein
MPGTTKPLNIAETSQLSLRSNLLNTKVSALLLQGSGTLANDAKQIVALYPPLEALPSALWLHGPWLLWFTGQACTCTVCVSSFGRQAGLFKESQVKGWQAEP